LGQANRAKKLAQVRTRNGVAIEYRRMLPSVEPRPFLQGSCQRDVGRSAEDLRGPPYEPKAGDPFGGLQNRYHII
jgi:hypothetical protein